jgi:hypothetical protein
MKMTASVLYTQKTVGQNGQKTQALGGVETEVLLVTPELASVWLVTHNYEHQRNISRSTVEFYAEEMRRQTFTQGTPLHFVRWHDSLHLVNGQHTLSAVVASGSPQILTLVYTSEDPAHAYYRHDRQRRRTTSDMFRSLDLGSELGLTNTQMNQVATGIKVIRSKFLGMGYLSESIHPNELQEFLREYSEAAGLYYESIAGKPHYMRPMERSATVAVALATFKHADVEKADAFWHSVAMDDGLSQSDPCKVSVVHLTTTRLGGGRSLGMTSRSVAYSCRYLGHCWNAFYAGRSITQSKVKPEHEKKAISLLGTPYDGSQE